MRSKQQTPKMSVAREYCQRLTESICLKSNRSSVLNIPHFHAIYAPSEISHININAVHSPDVSKTFRRFAFLPTRVLNLTSVYGTTHYPQHRQNNKKILLVADGFSSLARFESKERMKKRVSVYPRRDQFAKAQAP